MRDPTQNSKGWVQIARPGLKSQARPKIKEATLPNFDPAHKFKPRGLKPGGARRP